MFENVNKNFGFGMMRLPKRGKYIDYKKSNDMVDAFMKAGFNYFDTAKGYLDGKSETAVRKCVAERYPRNAFVLTDKLSSGFFDKEKDIRKVFEKQLKSCGVEYFDFYLMHAQTKGNYEKYQRCHAYEIAQELKAEGKIRHVGFSFHDDAQFLEKILIDHPEVEVVQLQLNYVDYDDEGVQSRKCLEVCRKYNKPVIVMEPVKGGNLVNLPEKADRLLRNLDGGSNASYAIRFAASCDGVFMVLSGMGDMEQMSDNLSYMSDFKPLNETEQNAIAQVCEIFRSQSLIPCTACRYCIDGCPKNILIPDLFADLNAKKQHNDWNPGYYYREVHTQNNGKASDCIKCGKCEKVCPQHLEIRKLLEQVSAEFDKQ